MYFGLRRFECKNELKLWISFGNDNSKITNKQLTLFAKYILILPIFFSPHVFFQHMFSFLLRNWDRRTDGLLLQSLWIRLLAQFGSWKTMQSIKAGPYLLLSALNKRGRVSILQPLFEHICQGLSTICSIYCRKRRPPVDVCLEHTSVFSRNLHRWWDIRLCPKESGKKK